ncbi:MAG: hypothetical protein K2W96_04990 [Gemmataceae bacterium]|nr:hypothetical protein [Gemmataceae bacterium]
MSHAAGYLRWDDETFPFQDAVCLESGWDMWDIEASGPECLFHLRKVIPRPGIVWIEGPDGYEWPNELVPLPEDDDLFADSGLSIPGRCLQITDVRAVLGGFDGERSLLHLSLKVSAVSDEGDFRADFELELACRCADAFREPDFE